MKTGLVLEGGGMRGMYTAGVLDFLMDKNIRFDEVSGVSAGACFGVNYFSNQKGRAIRYNKKYNGDKRYISFKSLVTTGNLVNTDFVYNVVPRNLDIFDDETFKNSGVDYYAAVTRVDTGEVEYIKIKSVFEQMDVLRASASLPFVSRPVEINGKKYLDGGVVDSIPYKKLLETGCDKIVVILTRDSGYVKKKMKKLPVDLFYGRYPRFAHKLKERHNNYNNSIKELNDLEKAGKIFIIRPSAPIEIDRMEKDPDKLQAVYDFGQRDAQGIFEGLSNYLAGGAGI